MLLIAQIPTVRQQNSRTPKDARCSCHGDRTSASLSKRPKSSLRVLTSSWAERISDMDVNPMMSANRMLQKEKMSTIKKIKSDKSYAKGYVALITLALSRLDLF